MADFCEQTVGVVLLQLVSRGQALIAELLRLSDRVPTEFVCTVSIYEPLLSDFSYFKSPELFEERIESDNSLAALDDDFRECFMGLLDRFFQLFNGIIGYYQALLHYLGDLQEGTYIQSTLESVLHNEDGCQLLIEALTLHGLLLMLLEHRLNGSLREKLLVAHFRCKGSFDLPNFDSLCTLCRNNSQPPTSSSSLISFLQGAPLPVPSTMIMLTRIEDIFARFPLPRSLIITVTGRLRSHDLYNQVRHYPDPEHRSTALMGQAASLFVLLYFTPDVLQSDSTTMREITDKFFKLYWAAKAALTSFNIPSAVQVLARNHISKVGVILKDLHTFLSDGLLTQEYVLNNMQSLLSCLRNCNVTLRWLLLQQITANRKLRDVVKGTITDEDSILTLLLDTSQLEFELKEVYGGLLKEKEVRWKNCRMHASECMQELCEFFSGSKMIARKVKDENLQLWFSQMASQMNCLEYSEAVGVGRKLQNMITALEEVEQFYQIQGSLQTKQCLLQAISQLQDMLRTLNVKENTLATISVVSDASFAWGLIGEYTKQMHARIQRHPLTVLKLQCLFLKLRSVMDIPLMRISQCHSADLLSVSQYYSSELVAYVRTILEIVPLSIFSILDDVIKAQAKRLAEIPGRLEKDTLRDYAKLEERQTLAKATQRVAVFTQGILSMKRTFIGAIELDPRQLLEEGIRKQLIKQIASALHNTLTFTSSNEGEFEEKLEELSTTLHSQRQSVEYFQDYVHVHGLKIWQEEYARTISYNTEQAANAFLKKKIQGEQSSYQDKRIPVPDFLPLSKDPSKACNFMGRIVWKLLTLTNPSKSMYLAPMSGWFSAEGKELVGLRTFSLLQESMGPAGISGIDTLISYEVANKLRDCISMLSSQMDGVIGDKIKALEAALTPPTAIPDGGLSVYTEWSTQTDSVNAWSEWVGRLAQIGQLQLIRCLLTSHQRAASQIDSSLITFCLKGLLRAQKEELRKKNLIAEQMRICGIFSPLKTIYLTVKAPEKLSLLLFLVTISQLPRYVVDNHLGTLTSRTKKSALDFCPLVVGFATLLQQFDSSYTTLYIQYVGQYVQTHIEHLPSKNKKNKEIRNSVAWILSLWKYVGLSQHELEMCLPPLLLESFFW